MKPTAFSLTIVLFAFLFSNCDKVEPSFCDKEVVLGEFSTTIEMPYDTFEYVLLFSENGDTAALSINHPSLLAGGEMFNHRNTVHSFSSDCQTLKSIEKYFWEVSEERALVLMSLPDIAPSILIKALPIVDETQPKEGIVAHYFQFFEEDPFSNVIKQEEFMSILADGVLAGQGGKWAHGATFIGNFTIFGQAFSEVYTNENDLKNGIKNIYFTINDGIVGVKDAQGILWRIDF